MKIEKKHFKPYIFILLFLLVPLLFFQVVKKILNKDKYEETRVISQLVEDAENTIPANNIEANTASFGIVIHGGAGNIVKDNIPQELEVAFKTKLFEAIQTGKSMLDNGDSAIYIIEAVIHILEDSPLFNAGKGAVFTHDGKNELDASIMDGRNKNAGAVSGVTIIKNPISAALAVMQKSEHVLLSGSGANKFAKSVGLEMVNPNYFYTEKRWNNLQNAIKRQNESKHGTVGCVVLDKNGNLAAGTSTGGMTNKKYGRIGDSPIIGAGTFADNNTCAISSTGHGEYFIRYSVAYDISARMKYKNQELKTAASSVISELKEVGGSGGVIGIDKNGNICMEFNTKGMFRAYYTNKCEPKVLMYKD